MSEEKVLANAEYGENHENDDMIAQHAVKSDETISFSVSDEAVLSTPGRKSRKERYG